MGKLENKVAIVTGAGQGVGRGIAIALAKEGASLVIVGRTLEKCVKTADEIVGFGGKALPVACNVHDREEVDAVISQAVDTFGTIHIVVNNAQAARPMVALEDTTDKDMKVSIGSGLYGTFYFMQACFPFLKNNGGRIINLGSVSALRGDPGFASYAMAKEGIRGLSRVAAREWGRYGITVNVICPFSDSPGVEYMIDNNPGFIDELTSETSLGRLGSSENDVGRTVAFLCSDDASYITGQTINVDGGMWVVP